MNTINFIFSMKQIINLLEKRIETELVGTGFTYIEFLILITLEKNDSLNQNDFAATLNIDKSTVSRAINSLVSKDCIKKGKATNDSRVNNIILSEKGQNLADKFSVALDKIILASLENISKYDAENIEFILETIYFNLFYEKK